MIDYLPNNQVDIILEMEIKLLLKTLNPLANKKCVFRLVHIQDVVFQNDIHRKLQRKVDKCNELVRLAASSKSLSTASILNLKLLLSYSTFMRGSSNRLRNSEQFYKGIEKLKNNEPVHYPILHSKSP